MTTPANVPTQNEVALSRFYEEVFNAHNSAFIDEALTEDFVEHEDIGDLPRTRDGAKAWFAGFTSSFPDLSATVESMSADGDRVWARLTIRGTHGGEFMGVPPTGKAFAITAIDELRFEGGRIAEHWGVSDALGLMQQLGLVPSGPSV